MDNIQETLLRLVNHRYKSRACTLLEDGCRFDLLKVVQRFQLNVLPEQYPPFNKVWQEFLDLVAHMLARWNSKHVVKFLRRE